MIEYDYLLDKSDGVTIEHHAPLFDTRISNVSKFKGHNSSGKTTLMDMIALSLYGDDSPGVLKKLQDKLSYLKNANNSEYCFKLSANVGDRYLRVSTRKKGYMSGHPVWESIVEESTDGVHYKELIKESFRKKYRLIYDMPDRPMERIQELASEAERELRSDIDRMHAIRSPLTNIIAAVESSRNEELIALLDEQIIKLQGSIKEKENELSKDNILLDKLERYYLASDLKMCQDNYQNVNSMLINLDSSEKRKKSDQKKSIKKYESEESEVKKLIKKMLSNYSSAVKKLSAMTKIDSKIVDNFSIFWEDITYERIFDTGCGRIYDYTKIATELINQIKQKYDGTGNEKLLEKKRVLQNLISVLEPYTKDKISVLNTSVSELYEKLIEEYKGLSSQIVEYESAMFVLENVNESIKNGRDADKKFENLGDKPIIEDSNEDYRELLERRLSEARKRLDDAEKAGIVKEVTFDNYLVIIDDGISDPALNLFVSLDFSDIIIEINKLKNDVEKQKQSLDSLNRSLRDLEKQSSEAKMKESHPLFDYLDELKILKSKMEKMIPAFQKKDTTLVELSRGNEVKKDADNELFLDSVWTYLGKKLGTIQHIGKLYDVDKIDMNSREIISGDIHINFRDMGTGESQMAYLIGLLNSDDPRTVIALFDEVDHMDPNVISKIQDRMKKMYDSGKLIIGLMAAPGDNVEVEQYE